jgi:NADH-quinone oxidoreductase subunit N
MVQVLIQIPDPIIFLTVIFGAVAIVIVALSIFGNKSSFLAQGLATGIFGFGIGYLVLYALGYFGAPQTPTVSSLLGADWISYLFGVAVLIASFLVALTSADYLSGSPNVSQFYALLVFVSTGAMLLACSTDLLMMFVAWELMSIPGYVLTGFTKNQTSNEAAVKYFIISAFASAVLLYGISLIYALTGTTAIAELRGTPFEIAVLALAFVLAGFGIKLAAVPFHMWIPDAYQGAPTVVSALLSTATKTATFAPAARIFFLMFQATTFQADWSLVFAVLSVLSMTIGNFAALTQRSVTRILAYSSIGQAGYILIGFAVGGSVGLTGSFFHLLNYATMQTTAFLAAAALIKHLGSDDLDAFDGVGRRTTLAPIALSFSLLALGGFPPLNGFWSKFVLFFAAINQGLGWLAIIAIINSFVSVAFYLRIVKHMYMDAGQDVSKFAVSSPFKIAFVLALIVIVGTGIDPYPIIQFSSTAASQLLAGIGQILPL